MAADEEVDLDQDRRWDQQRFLCRLDQRTASGVVCVDRSSDA